MELKTTLSLNFLEEMQMSEVEPYFGGDHVDCTDDGVTDCHNNGGVHPVGDPWMAAVRFIEDAYDRAYKISRDTDRRSVRVPVTIPARICLEIAEMLHTDLDKWGDWDFEVRGPLLTAGRNLMRKCWETLEGLTERRCGVCNASKPEDCDEQTWGGSSTKRHDWWPRVMMIEVPA